MSTYFITLRLQVSIKLIFNIGNSTNEICLATRTDLYGSDYSN